MNVIVSKQIIGCLFAVKLYCISFCANGQTKNAIGKVSHAEPLYIDLVRDLGARKGEQEWNIATEFSKSASYNKHGLLVEYEFAPVNRLGLEVEADFSFYSPPKHSAVKPGNQLDGVHIAAQYSFLVSPKYQTKLAVGYSQTFELIEFRDYGKRNFVNGAVYNPFFIAAKRWGRYFHSMVFTGPYFQSNLATHQLTKGWQLNASCHYNIPHTRHFIGVEVNQDIYQQHVATILRPQLKVKLNNQLAVGIVAGIPAGNSNEGISGFLRIIYEP